MICFSVLDQGGSSSSFPFFPTFYNLIQLFLVVCCLVTLRLTHFWLTCILGTFYSLNCSIDSSPHFQVVQVIISLFRTIGFQLVLVLSIVFGLLQTSMVTFSPSSQDDLTIFLDIVFRFFRVHVMRSLTIFWGRIL